MPDGRMCSLLCENGYDDSFSPKCRKQVSCEILPRLRMSRKFFICKSSCDKKGRQVAISAEVGLSGEVRPVNRIDQRITEAEKLGFETIVSSKGAKNKVVAQGINSLSLTKIEEVIALLFA